MNKNYQKGVRKERKIVNEARDKGFISFRSAGSHSPIDVCIIDKKGKIIEFVQAKPKDMSQKLKEHIEAGQVDLNGNFLVSFKVL